MLRYKVAFTDFVEIVFSSLLCGVFFHHFIVKNPL